MVSSGQDLALKQIKDIVSSSNGIILIDEIEEQVEPVSFLRIRLSILCDGVDMIAGGFDLYQRELVDVFVPADFPYSIPIAQSVHFRFKGQPHVQWGKHFCLYLSKSVEWKSRLGMFGFIKRLLSFYEAGAKKELDGPGGPIHPPVAYTTSSIKIIISVNAPKFEGENHIGFAEIRKIDDYLYELVDWHNTPVEIDVGHMLAPVMIFKDKLPNEFPSTFKEFLNSLEYDPREVASLLSLMLSLATRSNLKSAPQLIVVGTPMRGIVNGESQIHFGIWEFEKKLKSELEVLVSSATYKSKSESDQRKEIQFLLERQQMCWTQVYEDRPEIVVKRDSHSKIKALNGKRICLIGVGAIGSYLAELLVREGVLDLTLIDNGTVSPGIICRQNFEFQDIGKYKSLVTRNRLNRINPKINATAVVLDVLKAVKNRSIDFESFDLVIDATGSNLVTDILSDKSLVNQKFNLISIGINHNATYCMAISRPKESLLTAYDLFREIKMIICNRGDLNNFKDAFWTKQDLFQPEPGCSEPTFAGSYSDIVEVVNSTFKKILNFYIDTLEPAYVLYGPKMIIDEKFDSFESSVEKNEKYEVVISPLAAKQYKYFVKLGVEKRGSKLENGGLIFGAIDDHNKRIYIDVVSDAPQDSEFSPDEFSCGINGVVGYAEELRSRTMNTTEFLGMWHTHPDSPAMPSAKDKLAVLKLLRTRSKTTQQKALIGIFRTNGSTVENSNFFLYEENNV